MAARQVPASVPENSLDPSADDLRCCSFAFYLALRDMGLIGYATRYGPAGLLRHDRARAALKNGRHRDVRHWSPGTP
jgi:hypothetical protein